MLRSILLPLTLALALTTILAVPGAAIDMTVQYSADQVDANPGDGLCDTGTSPGTAKCTLRAAIMEANALPGPDTISLYVGTYTLSIPPDSTNADDTGDLNITDDLTIEGGYGRVIDGGAVDSIFRIVVASVTVRDLLLRNGGSTSSGCILVSGGGRVVLERVRIFDCSGYGGGGLRLLSGTAATLRDVWIDGCSASTGGGIESAGGDLLIERSTISGNTATGTGGGLIVSPGLGGVDGKAILVDSTVVGNSAGDHGGGLRVYTTAYLYNSAVTDNVCSTDLDGVGEGGGLSAAINSTTVLSNSVVALNTCGPFVLYRTPSDCTGAIELAGHDFMGLTDGCTVSSTAGGDILGVGAPLDPGLEPLADYGGFTPTLHPTASSPLVDAADPAGCEADPDGPGPAAPTILTEDQRGLPRPANGRCDIGPVEAQWLFADGFESGDVSAWAP